MGSAVSAVLPDTAWEALAASPDTVLVDVRTKAEWSFVGLPDLSALNKKPLLLEWVRLPGMSVNDRFGEDLLEQLGETAPSKIFFICRSGARSLQAAQLAAMSFAAVGQSVECVNVAEGFEGDLDADGHRGKISGWKARGLSWRQS